MIKRITKIRQNTVIVDRGDWFGDILTTEEIKKMKAKKGGKKGGKKC